MKFTRKNARRAKNDYLSNRRREASTDADWRYETRSSKPAHLNQQFRKPKEKLGEYY